MGRRLAVPIEDVIIRFALASDEPFLKANTYISSEIIRRKLESSEFIIATLSDEPVGFIQLEYLWSLVPYIALIRVVPEYRRRTIGQAMLRFLEEFLAAREHKYLYSSSQADEPEPKAWHRRVGFEECGSIRGINEGIDEIIFRKSIGSE